MPRTRPAALALALSTLAVGCSHADAGAPQAPLEPAPEVAAPPAPAAPLPANAQVITFDGDEPDVEPTTLVRSAPKRAPIPAFQLFGTRAGDGP